jgi:hypothetical protein
MYFDDLPSAGPADFRHKMRALVPSLVLAFVVTCISAMVRNCAMVPVGVRCCDESLVNLLGGDEHPKGSSAFSQPRERVSNAPLEDGVLSPLVLPSERCHFR